MDQLIVPMAIAAIFAFVLFLIGTNRKASTSLGDKSSNLTSFTVNATRDEIQRTVLMYSQMAGLSMEGIDPVTGVIVLGENMSFVKAHNGYWLHIYITDHANGHCTVEVGVSSKTYQIGFMLTPIRDKASNAIKAALIMNGRNVGMPYAPVVNRPLVQAQPYSPPRPNITFTRKP